MSDIWVIDWKSSTDVYDEMKTQGCVYFKIWNLYEALNKNLPRAERAGVLRLDKVTGILDDPPVVEVTDEVERRWIEFLHLREYYRTAIEPKAKQDRFYPYEGKKFPSVTTINGILKQEWASPWAAKMAVEYFKKVLTEWRQDDKPMTEEWIEYHLKKAKTAFRTKSKTAMDIGSIVHDAIHAYLSGAKPEPILGGNEQATNSFLAFLEWADSVKLKPIALEKVLIDPEHEIGGTTDFIGYAEIK